MSEAKVRHPLVGDVWGGVAAMLVALPAAIAYGVAVYAVLGPEYVGLGVRAGLLGAIAIAFVAALIGGAPRIISAPSAPAAAVLASVAADMLGPPGAGDPHRVAVLLGVLALFTGVLQAAYGALGGGRLMKYIPYPVVAGYLSAVAVMIFLAQVPKFLGTPGSTSLVKALTTPSLWEWPALVVGAATVAGMLGAPRLTKRVPAAIFGLLTGIGTYFVLAAIDTTLLRTSHNRLLLGDLAGAGMLSLDGFPALVGGLRGLSGADIVALIAPALTLSVLLSVDSLKTCVIVDALTFTRHNSNRTLLAQGAGNAVAALVGGMPGSGTMGATLVNLESGGRTRASGAMEGGAVLLAVLLFGRGLAWIPVASLAAILLVVATRMVDRSSFQLLRQRSTIVDFLVIATVVAVAVTSNLMAAAGAGVGLAMLLFIRDQIRGSVLRRKSYGNQTFSKQHRLPSEQAVLERHGAVTTICELQGSLFFGTTDQLFRELEADLPRCQYLILDLRRVQSLDYTAKHLFEQFEALLRQHHGTLLFSRMPARPELREYLAATRPADHPNAPRTFATLDDALQWAEDQLLAEHLPGGHRDDEPLPLHDFDLFRGIRSADALAALDASLARRHLAAGEVVFHAGDDSDALYLVRRGIVRVMLPLQAHGYHTLATFGRGTFFGEMAFLVRGRRSADAMATTAADVYVIPRAQFDAIVALHPCVAENVFEQVAYALAVRLRGADAELRAFYET